jgi:DNA-3-methyladenine glycosylase
MAITRRALARPATEVARSLLGAHVVSDVDGERVVVRLTEVEAYGGIGSDPASHAHRGRTPRNATMFERPGVLYVYFTYGMHWCANVVCEPEGDAAAVLLRAGDVIEGAAVATRRRPAARQARDLARGPARLASALGLAGEHDGVDLLGRASEVRLLGGTTVPDTAVRTGPRTGVRGAGAATPWRYWIDGEPTVSPYRPATPRATG